MLSRTALSTSNHLHLPSPFASSLDALFQRAAGSAFKSHLQPAFVLSIRLSSPTPTARSFTTSSAKHRKKMPPKKKEEEKKVLLGRPGNSLKSGIVRMKQLSTTPPSVLLILHHFSGRLSKCRQIDPFPSHHEMLIGQPSCESAVRHRTRQRLTLANTEFSVCYNRTRRSSCHRT